MRPFNTTLVDMIRSTGQFKFQASGIDYFTGAQAQAQIISLADDWTFPRLSTHPQRQHFREPIIWLAMLHEQKLLAMALLNQASAEMAAIVSFRVHPNYRNQKIGNALLAFCEKAGKEMGLHQLLLNYRTQWKNNAYWEKLLKKNHWQYQAPNMYYAYVYDAQAIYEGMRLHDFGTANLQAIDENTWQALQETIVQPDWKAELPAALNPLQLADRQLDKQASLLLLDDTQQHIIGWCIIHQMRADIWQVTSLYVKEAHRKSKLGLAMVREVAKRHQKRGRVHFMVQPENHKFLAYVRGYMLNWNCKLFRQEVVYKDL